MDLNAIPPMQGLLSAWRFRPGASPEALDGAAIVAALAAGDQEGVWLHFDLLDQRGRAVIAALPLPPMACQALLEPDEAPHLEPAGDAVCGAVPDFLYDAPAGTIAETALLHFALAPGLLVTARRHPLRAAHALSRAPVGGSPPELLAALLRSTTEEMGRGIQQLIARLAVLEDGMLRNGGGIDADRQVLGTLRRTALRLERVFAPFAETLIAAEDEPYDALTAPFCAPLLREARRHAAVLHGLEAFKERARIAQDEMAGLAAEETNRRLFVLSVISAAMLPASLIAGIFGMNVGSLPGVEQDWGFLMAMGLIAGSILGVLGALKAGRLL